MNYYKKAVPVLAVGLLATACSKEPHRMTQAEAVRKADEMTQNYKNHGLCGEWNAKQNAAGEWKPVLSEQNCSQQVMDLEGVQLASERTQKKSRTIEH